MYVIGISISIFLRYVKMIRIRAFGVNNGHASRCRKRYTEGYVDSVAILRYSISKNKYPNIAFNVCKPQQQSLYK